jgi:hypothetical protein
LEDFMKNSLIALIVALVVLISFVRPASAEVMFEKHTKVVEVLFKHMKWGWKQSFKFTDSTGKKLWPTTTLLKTCVDNVKYNCFYEVDSRGRERKLYQYRNVDGMVMVVYKFETKKTVIANQ